MKINGEQLESKLSLPSPHIFEKIFEKIVKHVKVTPSLCALFTICDLALFETGVCLNIHRKLGCLSSMTGSSSFYLVLEFNAVNGELC